MTYLARRLARLTLVARPIELDTSSSNITVLEQLADRLGAPPGTIPNYVGPSTIGHRLVIPTLTLGILTLIFVTARIAIKSIITNALGWDGLLSVAAVLCVLARAVVSCIFVKWGICRHLWDVVPADFTRIRNMIWIADMIYLLGILFAKLFNLILYRKIFSPNKTFRWLCYVMMACCAQYYTWHPVPLRNPAKCLNIVAVVIAIGALNLANDLIILVMRLPLVWRLNLRRSQMCGVVAIFLTGLFIVATTIARLIIVVTTLVDFDQSYVVVAKELWLTVELHIAIICGCLPVLAPLYARLLSIKHRLSSVRHLFSRSFKVSRSWFSHSQSLSPKGSLSTSHTHDKGIASSQNSDMKPVPSYCFNEQPQNESGVDTS